MCKTLRFMLLLISGSLFGCATENVDTSTNLDSDVGAYRGPITSDAGVTAEVESRGVDVGSDASSRETTIDVLPIANDARSSIDAIAGHCLADAIANGYASASASCANPPKTVYVNTDRFATPEEACRFAIDCYAANGCINYNTSSAACDSCTFLPWTSRVPIDWLTSIAAAYCPAFFTR